MAAQDGDDDSMLALHRRAIWLRKREPSLLRGGYRELPSPDGVFAFQRQAPGCRAVAVFVNTVGAGHECVLPFAGTTILASDRGLEGQRLVARVDVPALGAVMVAGD